MAKDLAVIVEKEVSEYNDQVSFVQDKANGLTVASDSDMTTASDLLNDLKQVETSITERKQAITRPLMTALSSARELFKPLEKGYADAKKTIKDKMVAYSEEEEERIEKERERVEARVLRGSMRADTAVKKIEEAGEIKKTFEGGTSKTSIRVITKVRIVDELQIPRDYLTPDIKAITEAVLRQKKVINGVETYSEKNIVGRSN
jgi:hypothetical protein